METSFSETPEGKIFIASGPSRETSPEIMDAIAFFARTLTQAEAIWDGDLDAGDALAISIWERVTNNGRLNYELFVWGTSGADWRRAAQK